MSICIFSGIMDVCTIPNQESTHLRFPLPHEPAYAWHLTQWNSPPPNLSHPRQCEYLRWCRAVRCDDALCLMSSSSSLLLPSFIPLEVWCYVKGEIRSHSSDHALTKQKQIARISRALNTFIVMQKCTPVEIKIYAIDLYRATVLITMNQS